MLVQPWEPSTVEDEAGVTQRLGKDSSDRTSGRVAACWDPVSLGDTHVKLQPDKPALAYATEGLVVCVYIMEAGTCYSGFLPDRYWATTEAHSPGWQGKLVETVRLDVSGGQGGRDR